ncbi:MAG: GNAT family N-acetyltransferase, partial [Candidatus Poribacteria bacterium]
MYTKLSDVKLKTGEDMEIGVVLAPDQEHIEAITKVLHHKGEPWLTHVNKALDGTITDLETRFYIGKLNGQVVANIMTVEYNHTGILGHVFTIPEQRRKHICTLIMEQQMNDFKKRGGILLLGTGFNSAPYWIYYSFGFRSVLENSGFMRFSTDDNFEEKHFTYSKVKPVDVQWKHWSLMAVLMSVKETELMKSVANGLYGIINFEGGFLNFMKRLEDGNVKAKVLESESGAVVGCITLEQDRRWAS